MAELAKLSAALLAFGLVACAPAEGPAPVAWDRTRCAQCGMLISDPAFASQRHLASGEVLHYDDPGCLLAALEAEPDKSGELYFHHHRDERWLRGDETVLAAAAPSPMGYDLGAFARAEAPEGLSLARARAIALALDRARARP